MFFFFTKCGWSRAFSENEVESNIIFRSMPDSNPDPKLMQKPDPHPKFFVGSTALASFDGSGPFWTRSGWAALDPKPHPDPISGI